MDEYEIEETFEGEIRIWRREGFNMYIAEEHTYTNYDHPDLEGEEMNPWANTFGETNRIKKASNPHNIEASEWQLTQH